MESEITWVIWKGFRIVEDVVGQCMSSVVWICIYEEGLGLVL